jgi:predicted cupin superfamily sugar epimerase
LTLTGGFFAESFRSDINVDLDQGTKKRTASTAIYFLVTPGNVSRLHRIQSDEVWHFYLGGPLTVIELDAGESKGYRATVLGQDVVAGQLQQYVVKRGTWFGCYPADGTEFSFVGCTVAPGFEFQDFELASRAALLAAFPESASDVIVKLTDGLP